MDWPGSFVEAAKGEIFIGDGNGIIHRFGLAAITQFGIAKLLLIRSFGLSPSYPGLFRVCFKVSHTLGRFVLDSGIFWKGMLRVTFITVVRAQYVFYHGQQIVIGKWSLQRGIGF
jgi:hypothetical protein